MPQHNPQGGAQFVRHDGDKIALQAIAFQGFLIRLARLLE